MAFQSEMLTGERYRLTSRDYRLSAGWPIACGMSYANQTERSIILRMGDIKLRTKGFNRTTAASLFAVLTLAAVVSPAEAATSTGTLSVTATVNSVCLISNGTLAFGGYDPTAATALDAATTLTLTCTLGTPYNIGMAAGSGAGATVTLRQLTSGANTLGYRLFRDAARTLNWGNTVGTDTLSGTSSATVLANTINVYGRIPANEAAPTGSYTDSVTVTVTF